MAFDNSGFHHAVAAERNRQIRLGHTPEHDDEQGIEHLLEMAFRYASIGSTVRAGAMILAAQSYLKRHTKNSMQEDIEKFMKACDQEVRKYPSLPSDEVRDLRIKLMREELLGSTKGYYGSADHGLIPNKSDELIQSMLDGDIVGIADGIADVLYVVIGTAAAYGIDIQLVFNEVQRSNMTKAVWDEGTQSWTTIKNEHGKVLKPDTFSPADLEPIVLSQIENGKIMEEFEESQASLSEVVVATIED